jgi:tRNA modification GTPase
MTRPSNCTEKTRADKGSQVDTVGVDTLHSVDTIVACATAWGRSAIGVVRLSGSQTQGILERICRPKGGFPPPRRARLTALFDEDGVFDEGLLTVFVAKSSYTGEQAAEISCHGNPLLIERLIAACVGAGARVANPGEFTRRAFLNGRMDLTRAEAVLQAIEASSSEGLRVARAGLDGAVSGLADAMRLALTHAIAEIEARLDYPGEDLVFEEEALLMEGLRKLAGRAQVAAESYATGRILVEGATVALVGPVNAGKSSLFNALGGSERALVSSIPGTTRDVVERSIRLGPVSIRLLDTAGERQAEGLEAEGIALGRRLTADADLLVVVVPAHQPQEAAELLQETATRQRIVVGNHSDRVDAQSELNGVALLPTSALSGLGIERLGEAISSALIGELPGGASLVIASQRQRDLLLHVSRQIRESIAAFEGELGFALSAELLYGALVPLDALVGRDSREAVLDALFSRFCIGK